MTTKGMLLALLCLCSATAFGYWRYKARGESRGVAQIAIVRDRSDSTPNDCSRIVGLAERALGVPEIGPGSRITLLAFGDEETANEPRLLGEFKVPVIRRVIEGQRAATREREDLLTRLGQQCEAVGQTQVSPIFQTLKRGVEHLRSVGSADDTRYLFIQTDGEETVNAQVKQALKSSGAKLNLPPPIQNAGVRVIFCGIAETIGAPGPNNNKARPPRQREVQRPDRLREVWSGVFTDPQLVSFEPFCSKSEFKGDDRALAGNN